MIATALFAPTLANLLIAVGALTYVVSLAKNYRPIQMLRAENKELRNLLETEQRARAASEKKITALEAQVRILEKATDLTVLQQEHKQIAATLEGVIGRLESLDGAVRANTAATEAIARSSSLKTTLEELDVERKP